MAEVVEDQLTAWRFREERPGDEETRRRFAQQAASHGGGADPMAFSHANHTRNLGAFLEALEQRRKPALDGVESLKALEIVQAVYQSAETGQPARVR
jgi:predicted dehydrogenase